VRCGVGARAVAVYVRGEDALDRSERGVAVVEERGRTRGEERASPVEDDEALAAELRREGREVVRVVRDEGVDDAGGGEVGRAGTRARRARADRARRRSRRA
jgi:hypothetical protein